MKPWKQLDQSKTPTGGTLTLSERNGVFVVRVDGHELMSSRVHGSEEAMARAVMEEDRGRSLRRVLIGGLGLGYTLRAVLDVADAKTEIIVAELIPAVVAWNRGLLGSLNDHAVDDQRVDVRVGDVLGVLERERDLSAILLDVDNGPSALTVRSNQQLYDARGLSACRRALIPGGRLVVWSAGPDDRYLGRLREAGFQRAEQRVVPASPHGARKHTLFVAET